MLDLFKDINEVFASVHEIGIDRREIDEFVVIIDAQLIIQGVHEAFNTVFSSCVDDCRRKRVKSHRRTN